MMKIAKNKVWILEVFKMIFNLMGQEQHYKWWYYYSVIDRKLLIIISVVVVLLFANLLIEFEKHVGEGLYYLLNS